MPAKPSGFITKLSGLTSASAQIDDLTVKLRPSVPCSIAVGLTSGAPATGLQVQVTNSDHADMDNGSAVWVAPSGIGATLVGNMYVSTAGEGCQLTGVRFVITDGTWSAVIRQVN